MPSIVADLQRDALDSSIKVADLLRKALVASRKLGLQEFGTWIQNELDGYSEAIDIPEYRLVYGEIKGWNPYRGWIPVFFGDPREAEILSNRKIGQSIAELESISITNDTTLHMPFPPEIQSKLASNMRVPLQVTLFVPTTTIVKIIDSVRTIILNWALKLEDDGILGEGFSFTHKEKKTASRTEQGIANYFFGPVGTAQSQQGGTHNIQLGNLTEANLSEISALVEKINDSIDKVNLSIESRNEFESEVSTIRAQAKSSNPKKSIIMESMRSIREILQGAGGTLAAQLIIELSKHIFI